MGRPRRLARLARILWVFTRKGLLFALYLDVYRGHIYNKSCTCDPEQALLSRARRLREALEELGPTFVKLGQLLSRRPDLFPGSYLAELEKLQDRTPPLPLATIMGALTATCICEGAGPHAAHMARDNPLCLHRNPLESILGSLSEAPLASASLAQVHRAVFRGQDVAVKILKPGVLDTINQDLEILWGLRKLFARILGFGRYLDVDGFIVEFRRSLQAEVDLRAEALNIETFREKNRPDTPVTAPRVFWGFERSDLLVMELVNGRPLRDARELPAETRTELARRIARNFLKQIFVDNFFHADPHPGNLFLTAELQIVYLDFGAVGRLDEQVRLQVQIMFFAVTHGDSERVLRALLRLSQMEASQVAGLEGLRQDIERIIQAYRTPAVGRWTDMILETARAHEISLPRSILLLAKALVLIESLALDLDPALNAMREIESFAGEVTKEQIRRIVGLELPAILEEYARLAAELPALVRAHLTAEPNAEPRRRRR